MTAVGDCPRCGSPVDPGRARAATGAAQPPSVSSAAPTSSTPAVSTGAEGAPGAEGGEGAEGDAADADWVPDLEPVPWHLKLLAGAVALYLGWRAFQGIEWLVHRF